MNKTIKLDNFLTKQTADIEEIVDSNKEKFVEHVKEVFIEVFKKHFKTDERDKVVGEYHLKRMPMLYTIYVVKENEKLDFLRDHVRAFIVRMIENGMFDFEKEKLVMRPDERTKIDYRFSPGGPYVFIFYDADFPVFICEKNKDKCRKTEYRAYVTFCRLDKH